MTLLPRRSAARQHRHNAEAPRRRTRLGIESLESRWTPAVFNVNTLVDALSLPAGQLSLRMAINEANATPGGNTINLTVPGTYNILLPGPTATDNQSGEFAILPSGGNLTIQNASGGAVAVSGDGLNRVFDINPADTGTNAPFLVKMVGFTIENGVASPGDGAAGSGGGIRDQGNASLELDSMVVTDNTATADGGGIAMENAANVPWHLITNATTISYNHAGDAGGGIDEDGQGVLQINGGTLITGNTTTNQGGGIWLDAINGVTANTTITGAVITNNVAFAGTGGGVGNAGNAAVVINHTVLQGNFSGTTGGGFGDENNLGTLTVEGGSFVDYNASLQGGGGLQEAGTSTIIADSTIQGNVTQGNGGGLLAGNFPAATGGTVAVFDTVINGNVGVNGGGIEDNAAALGVADVFIAMNRATGLNGGTDGNGGGIDASSGGGAVSIAISQALIANNQAGNNGVGNGGGINDASGNLSLTNSYLVRNAAGNFGGGLNFAGGTTQIVGTTFDANRSALGGGGLNFLGTNAGAGGSVLLNDTFANNISLGPGGGINDAAAGDLVLVADTVAFNIGTNGGGIAQSGTGKLSLANTVVAQNAGTVTGNDVFTATGLTVTDLGGNFIGNLSGSTGFGPNTLTGNAGLTALANNGGPKAGTLASNITILTIAPAQGSPLYNAGSTSFVPPIDQRGVTRPANTKPTIGAYQ